MSVTSVTNPANVHTAIAAASQRTGMDFNYLLGQAQVESGMRANARARTSSATGLYQFIEQSWLAVVKRHGADHGMAWAADAIRQGANGRYTIDDPGMRRAILDLRTNPAAAAAMAAEHAADNKSALEGTLGREATGTDLYMAHFLGLGGARSFLGAMAANPDRNAAAMFPLAARANRSIFYAPNGAPRSLGEIYQTFADRLDRGAMAVGGTGLASGALGAMPGANPGGLAAAGLHNNAGVEVVLGNGASDGDRQWIASTLDQLNLANARREGTALRPTPATARLAYMLLARLGA